MSRQLVVFVVLAFLVGACGAGPKPIRPDPVDQVTLAAARAPVAVNRADLVATVATLSHDSMAGRFTGSPEAAQAASYLAGKLAEYGFEPAGDSGFYQRVPLKVVELPDGRLRYDYYPSLRALRQLPADQQLVGLNVVARLPGSDQELAQAIVIEAYYDHLGVRRPINGDSIYNGADGNASGVSVALEIARDLASGQRPRRTVVVLFTVGEKLDFAGARFYAEQPAAPLQATAAALSLELVGRPDPELEPGQLWLAGEDRTTLWDIIDDAGVDLELDPRPDLDFFSRMESVILAQRGVPSHTLSSYGMHGDYSMPSDEAGGLDYDHLAQVAETSIRVARVLANGPRPMFYPGSRPRRTDF